MVVLDALEKAAWVRLLQVEQNDLAGAVIKISGSVGSVTAALDAARALAASLETECLVDVIANPDEQAVRAWDAQPEFNPLMEQSVVYAPRPVDQNKEQTVSGQAGFAVGLIETQGFTAVFEAIDTACKAANVEVLAREKLGGGFITVVIKGDVAAVRAAVDAGKAKVEGLGKLIAAHVIPSPSEGVLSLLPK